MTSPFDEWSDIYDSVYSYLKEDIAFYVEEALAVGGPVLELGCGTGRVAVPMAQAGAEVVGLDSSRAMLSKASAKIRRRRRGQRIVVAGSGRHARPSVRPAVLTGRGAIQRTPVPSFGGRPGPDPERDQESPRSDRQAGVQRLRARPEHAPAGGRRPLPLPRRHRSGDRDYPSCSGTSRVTTTTTR